jgi:hypothetical protein
MHIRRLFIGSATAFALSVASIATIGPAGATMAAVTSQDDDSVDNTPGAVHIQLNAPTPQLAACMPRADVRVTIKPTEEDKGFDIFDITARHVAPNREYTVFLLEEANFPFGAAEYIGDLKVNGQGDGHAQYHTIVNEAFASTIVDGKRVRVDLTQIGLWFADPKDDDFCLGPNGGPVTPFDGDNVAGGLAFNSAPAPAGLPAAPVVTVNH